jgi:hypothetical protein
MKMMNIRKKTFEEKMKKENFKSQEEMEKSRKKFEHDMAKEDFNILLQEKIKTEVNSL